MPSPKQFLDVFAESMMGARALRALLPSGIPQLLLRRTGSLQTALSMVLDALENPAPVRAWAIMPMEIANPMAAIRQSVKKRVMSVLPI